MADSVEIQWTPPDLPRRFARYPQETDNAIHGASDASLRTLHGNVLPYAPRRPGQVYIRTERLGRSLGSGFGGGAQGQPNIFEVKRLGVGNYEGRFGSRLFYAPDVIGTGTQTAWFTGRWWQMRDILTKSLAGIEKNFTDAAKKLVAFISGKA